MRSVFCPEGIRTYTLKYETYTFLKNYITSEGVVSHNVVHYQQLCDACYHVSLFANICFE